MGQSNRITEMGSAKSTARGVSYVRKTRLTDGVEYVPARYSGHTFGLRPAAIRSRPLSARVGRPRRLLNDLFIARAKKCMTQQDLADAVGISRVALSNIEIGKSVPSVGTALVLAEVLNAELKDLFYLETFRQINDMRAD